MTLGSHQQSVGKDQARFTPRWITDPLGPFATDAAAGDPRPWDIGTERNITKEQNCLTMDWRPFKRTWLNPPFLRYVVGDFVRKMCEHDHGTLLLHVRTETEWFKPIWEYASGLLFLAGRVIFLKADGAPCTIENPQAKHYGKTANSGAPVVLCAFGFDDLDRLDASGIEGAIVPLRFARFVLAAIVNPESSLPLGEDATWRQIVLAWLKTNDGPIAVADLYRAFAHHPKAQRNPNWKPKLRQTLLRGAGKRVARDQWVAA